MDGGIPPETVNEFVGALRSAGIENDVHIYDAVDHGFWLRVDDDPELPRRTGPRRHGSAFGPTSSVRSLTD